MAQRNPHRAPAGRPRPRRLTVAGVAAALALVGAACGDDGDGGSSAEAGSGSGGGGGGDLSIAISSPEDGAQVGESFDVELDPSVEVGEPDTGLHHVHLYYDGQTAEGEYDLVYGNSFTVEGLPPGEHEVEAVIANADHSLTDARQAITVQVGDTAGGGGATTTSQPEDEGGEDEGGGGYGY